jgi:hypothetical protein
VSITFFLLTCISGILYLYRTHKLEKIITKVLYYDYQRYNPNKMKLEDYFLGRETKTLLIDPLVTSVRTINIQNISNGIDNRNEHLKLKENQNETSRENEIVYNNNNRVNDKRAVTCQDNKKLRNQINEKKTVSDYEQLNGIDSYIYDKRPIITYLKTRLILDHPILSLIFKKSLKDPFFIRFFKLIFSLNMLFGVTVILYTDDLIDQSDSNISVVSIVIKQVN